MLKTERFGPVRSFKLSRIYYFTGAYLVDGLLVDTGCHHTRRELFEALRGAMPHTVVNTHSHEDHIGANALLEREGVRILAHPKAIPIIREPERLNLKRYQRFFWGLPEPSSPQPIGEEVETDHHRFQVLEVPGHSPDHIALYEPDEGWLFCGDAYWGGKDRAFRPFYRPAQMLASLKKMAALDVSIIFPGSGNPRTDGLKHLHKKIEYLEELKDKILEMHRQGLSPEAIRKRLFGRESLIAWLTGGDFSAINLVNGFLKDFTEEDQILDKGEGKGYYKP